MSTDTGDRLTSELLPSRGMLRDRTRRIVLEVVVPILAMIALWDALAIVLGDPNTLPRPVMTFERTVTVATTEDFHGLTGIDHLQYSLRRAVLASLLALAASVAVGVLMTTSRPFEKGLSSLLPFAMTIPTVVIILLSMVWLGFNERGVIIAVVIASTPFGIVNMWQGAQDIDTDLITMAQSFGASTVQLWRDVYVPHLLPYIFGSYRYVFGMVWKIVVLGEVFGLQEGLGTRFRYHYQIGEIESVLAYLMLFVIVILVVEYVVLKPVEAYAFKWKD